MTTEIGLPEGWCSASIGDMSGHADQRIPAGEEQFTYIDISAVDRQKKVIVEPQRITGTAAPSRARQVVRTGDVVVSMTRPNLNAVAMVPLEFDGQIASTGFDVLRPLETDGRWLFAVVRTAEFVASMTALVQGALYPAVRPTDIRGYEIPVAPLNEQKRIADKLDALLARVDACRERLDRVPALLKRFRQSVLAAATSGALTAEWRERNATSTSGTDLLNELRRQHTEYSRGGSPNIGDTTPRRHARAAAFPQPVSSDDLPVIPESWAWASGGEVVQPGAEIVYGIVQPGPKLANGIPYVRGMDIENGRILEHQLLRTSPGIASRYSRSALRGGDVLLGIIRATKVAKVPASLEGANITQGTARFRPSLGILTEFLAVAIEAPSTQLWLHEQYRGIDMPGLNLADVRLVPLPLPPISEQAEIARRVERLLADADRLEASYAAARTHSERLTPALLAKAFRGELVPQDPNDEPASVLLERIRAARLAESKPSRSRRPARAVSALQFEVLDAREAPTSEEQLGISAAS